MPTNLPMTIIYSKDEEGWFTVRRYAMVDLPKEAPISSNVWIVPGTVSQ